MSVTIRTGWMKYKNPNTDEYQGIDAITDASTADRVAAINSAGATQIAAVEAKGIETRASIPADYTTLSDDVEDLKSAIDQSQALDIQVKKALLALFQKCAFVDDDAQGYYDALEDALNPPTNLNHIAAVYTQSGAVYDTDTLDSLKSDLVVTAYYNSGASVAVSNYAMTGIFIGGESTITVVYGGKTTTFTVNVSEVVKHIAADDTVYLFTDIEPVVGHSYEMYGYLDISSVSTQSKLAKFGDFSTYAGGTVAKGTVSRLEYYYANGNSNIIPENNGSRTYSGAIVNITGSNAVTFTSITYEGNAVSASKSKIAGPAGKFGIRISKFLRWSRIVEKDANNEIVNDYVAALDQKGHACMRNKTTGQCYYDSNMACYIYELQ